MFKCKKCLKKFKRYSFYLKHIEKCNIQYTKIGNGKAICDFCDKEFSVIGIKNHINQSHLGKKNPMSGKTAWNKGLTKENNTSVEQISKTLKKGFEDGRLIGSQTGRPLSEEHKVSISKSRIKFLKENPNKVPYMLNHHSKGESYPEKYFREILENNNIDFIQEKREGLYSLDFVIGKVDLEIDGDQHYFDKRIIESDKKRTLFLEDKGYSLIRIKWSDYQKLDKYEKISFVNDIIARIKMGC